MKKGKPEIIKIDPFEEKEVIWWPQTLSDEIKKRLAARDEKRRRISTWPRSARIGAK